MKTLISSCAPQDVGCVPKAEKEFGVVVDLDALIRLESGQDHQDGGGPSRSWTTSMTLTPSVLASPALAKETILEEPRTEPILALRENPDAPARTTKNRAEYLRALTNDIHNRVRRGVVKTSSIDVPCEMGQTTPEGAVEETFDSWEDLQPEPEYVPLREARFDNGKNTGEAEQRAERAQVAPMPAAPTSRATEPGEVELTRSLTRRILLRVALSLAFVFLSSFCIGFLHEIVGAKKSHFRAGSAESNSEGLNRLPPEVSEPTAVVAQMPAKPSITEPEPITSRPAETGFAEPLNTSHLQIKALETSWVSATVNEKEVLGKLLAEGEIREIAFSKVLLLRLGNAGGVEITLDGNRIAPIGSRGVVRLVELTPMGFRILPWSVAHGSL